MARLATLTKGIWEQFERNLSAQGLSAEDVVKLNTDPTILSTMFACMREQPTFKLIHGVFNSITNILKSLALRCADKGIALSKFTWVGGETCPFAFTDDPEMVVVLDITLDTLHSTVDFAWDWTCDGQDANWRWEGMLSDPSKLRLLEGSDAFVPYILRWRRIKLNTDIGKKPMDVRNPQASPGVALLFVAAQHPQRVKVIDYKTKFGWYLPGLQCTVPGNDVWQDVPYVDFDRVHREVRLDTSGCYGGDSCLVAVPVFRE